MKWMRVLMFCSLLISIQLLIGTACQNIAKRSQQQLSQVEDSGEKEMVAAAEKLYFEKKYREAEESFALFVKNKPTSFYFFRAQIGLARSVYEQKRWAEAAEIYRQIEDASNQYHPEIAGMALFELSFCYENLGDEDRVLASLMDAQKQQQHLPSEIGQAEIPARIAASYHRMGQENEANRYMLMAQKGIAQIQVGRELNTETKQWLAEIYYRMGRFSTLQIREDNLHAQLDTLKMIQIFSLRCVETEVLPWAKSATDDLLSNYQDFFNFVMQMQTNKVLDVAVAHREKVDRQMYYVGMLLAHIADLKSQRLVIDKIGAEQSRLLDGLAELEQKGQNFLLNSNVQTPLTPEALHKKEKKQSNKKNNK